MQRSGATWMRRFGLGGLALGLSVVGVAWAADGALDAEAIRERRTFRVERPWWREALEWPEDAVDILGWPLERATLFAEKVNLPERILDTLYFDDERTSGLFPNLSFGGEIQSAVGFHLFDENVLGDGEELSLSTLMATNDFEERRLDTRGYDPKIGGSLLGVLADLHYSEDNDEDFFVRERADGTLVTGRNAGENDDRTYELDRVSGRLELGLGMGEQLATTISFEPIYGDVDPGGGAEQAIPSQIDGFGGPVVLLGGGTSVQWTSLAPDPRPRKGWLLRFDGGGWSGVRGETTQGEEYRYLRYGVDVRRFQPTFRHDRFLVLRGLLHRVETIDGAVPFWELPTLDEDHGLRGFSRNRFRDRGALLFNVEYRYPIWTLWDAVWFFDEGQVFREYRDVELGAFEWSAGAGILFFGEDGLFFEARLARSEEETLFKIVFDRVF